MSFPGKGGRRPQIDVNIDLIELDDENPRLVPYIIPGSDKEKTQEDLIDILYEHFDNEYLADSLVNNGYFDEEPVILVPIDTPDDFNPKDYNDVDTLTRKYKELIELGQIKFKVIEGNRRVSAIKLILNPNIRKNLGITNYPSISDPDIEKDIRSIPSIIYPVKEEVFDYLGIRHISGNLKWEAFAQATFTSNIISYQISKFGINQTEAIQKVRKIIGSRTDTITKQFVAYQIYKQALVDLEFDVRPIKRKFSLLTVAFNSKSIREFVGLKDFNNIDFKSKLISEDYFENFRYLLSWIFGDTKKGEVSIISDSRKITNSLRVILSKVESTEHLIVTRDLEGALEKAEPEEVLLIRAILKATKSIESTLSYAYKFKEHPEASQRIVELENSIEALKRNLEVND